MAEKHQHEGGRPPAASRHSHSADQVPPVGRAWPSGSSPALFSQQVPQCLEVFEL